MSTPLSLSAACYRLGQAASGVVAAAWRAPFTGSRIRLVTVGLPVLFATTGAGVVIHKIMTQILSSTYSKLAKGATSLFNRVFPKPPRQPPEQPAAASRRSNQRRERIQSSSMTTSLASSEADTEEFFSPLESPTIDVGQERNAALIKFLHFIEQNLLYPWIPSIQAQLNKVDDPVAQALANDSATLKNFLQTLTLWQLSCRWEQLEQLYLQQKMPKPPTQKSLERDVRAQELEPTLTSQLIAFIKAEGSDNVPAFQSAVTQALLTTKKKIALFKISLHLSQQRPDQGVQDREKEELRAQFAKMMNSGLATTLDHTLEIIEGWTRCFVQPSTHAPAPATLTMGALFETLAPDDREPSDREQKLGEMVRRVAEAFETGVGQNYLVPLFADRVAQYQSDQLHTFPRQLADKLDQGVISVEEFLRDEGSCELSTQHTGQFFFLRLVSLLQGQSQSLDATLQVLPRQLLLKSEPLLVPMLSKGEQMLCSISLKTTVPRVAQHFIEFLFFCRAMHTIQQQPEQTSREPLEEKENKMQTQWVGISQEDWEKVQALAQGAPKEQVTGRNIIQAMGSQVHECVRGAPGEVQEVNWLRLKWTEIENILILKGSDLSKTEQAQRLRALLEGTGEEGNILDAALRLQNKLFSWVPGADYLKQFIGVGLGAVIQAKGQNGAQKALNHLTSTGFLSKAIGTTIVKGMIGQGNYQQTWDSLPSNVRKAYQFLNAEERTNVLKHLQSQGPTPEVFQKRKQELSQPIEDVDHSIQEILDKEGELEDGLKLIKAALKALRKGGVTEGWEINSLKAARSKLTREKELCQFKRVQGLVGFAADDFFSKKLPFLATGAFKPIILSLIDQAYSLLAYQEVVKHWVFTFIDLLIDELKKSAQSTNGEVQPATEALIEEPVSVLTFITSEQDEAIGRELTQLIQLLQQDRGWSLSSVVSSLASFVPAQVWGQIKGQLDPHLRVTPAQLTKIAMDKFETFATDPHGLAALVAQQLTEKVANPRPEPEEKDSSPAAVEEKKESPSWRASTDNIDRQTPIPAAEELD